MRINVLQKKALSDASRLTLGTNLVQGRYCTSVRLVSYAITGTSGSLPSHVLLRIRNLGSSCEYTTVSLGNGQNSTVDDRDTKFILYPPGGVQTQSRTCPSIGFVDEGQVLNMQNLRMELQTFNATTQQYERWDDYTDCVLEFDITSYEHASSYRKTIQRR